MGFGVKFIQQVLSPCHVNCKYTAPAPWEFTALWGSLALLTRVQAVGGTESVWKKKQQKTTTFADHTWVLWWFPEHQSDSVMT